MSPGIRQWFSHSEQCTNSAVLLMDCIFWPLVQISARRNNSCNVHYHYYLSLSLEKHIPTGIQNAPSLETPMSRLMKHELLMELWVSVCIAEEMGLMIFKGPFHLKWIYDSISAAFHWQKKSKNWQSFLSHSVVLWNWHGLNQIYCAVPITWHVSVFLMSESMCLEPW